MLVTKLQYLPTNHRNQASNPHPHVPSVARLPGSTLSTLRRCCAIRRPTRHLWRKSGRRPHRSNSELFSLVPARTVHRQTQTGRRPCCRRLPCRNGELSLRCRTGDSPAWPYTTCDNVTFERIVERARLGHRQRGRPTQHHNLPIQYSTPRPRTFLAESSSRSGDLEAFPPAVRVAVLQRLGKLAGVDRPA